MALPVFRRDHGGGVDAGSGGLGLGATRRDNVVFVYLRRMCNPEQMDWEYTFRQMVYLLTSPSKVYQLSQYRKKTRNHWARDDPAFLVLNVFFTLATAVAYGIAFQVSDFSDYMILFFYSFLYLVVFGAIAATVGSSLANSRLRVHDSGHSVEQKVEWLYAFDIHTNAYFPTFLLLGVLQYLMLPFLMGTSIFAALVSNTLYLVGATAYCYITHLGYRSMPFLDHTQVFLYPVFAFMVLWLLFALLHVNSTRVAAWFFFE